MFIKMSWLHKNIVGYLFKIALEEQVTVVYNLTVDIKLIHVISGILQRFLAKFGLLCLLVIF